eukprot:5573548-Ditylum_brightwellii.AAC.1
MMFVAKRGRPDVNPGVSFLTTRVKGPNEGDWTKLLKLMGFLKGTIQDILRLEAGNEMQLK